MPICKEYTSSGIGQLWKATNHGSMKEFSTIMTILGMIPN